jgi:hypothetical protein
MDYAAAFVFLIRSEGRLVIPAKAGIQSGRQKTSWIPDQARNDGPNGSKLLRSNESG